MAVHYIPPGYHTVTPYLVIHNVAAVLDFVKKAFDAKETHPAMKRPDGAVMHAEVQIGDSRIMMGEASAQHPPIPAMLYLYVPDCDAWYQRALEAGGVSVMAPMDHFYGDRSGGVKDPAGNQWWIGTHIEDVSPEEIQRRASQAKG
ncbi:MAG: VOC family protein [Gemmataceae bacterium]